MEYFDKLRFNVAESSKLLRLHPFHIHIRSHIFWAGWVGKKTLCLSYLPAISLHPTGKEVKNPVLCSYIEYFFCQYSPLPIARIAIFCPFCHVISAYYTNPVRMTTFVRHLATKSTHVRRQYLACTIMKTERLLFAVGHFLPGKIPRKCILSSAAIDSSSFSICIIIREPRMQSSRQTDDGLAWIVNKLHYIICISTILLLNNGRISKENGYEILTEVALRKNIW